MKTTKARQAGTAVWLHSMIADLVSRPRTPAQWAYLVLWLFFLFCYPFAAVGVAFDVRAGFSMAWAGSVMLLAQGSIAALWLVQSFGTRQGGILAIWIALGCWAGEALGAGTGWPFGRYRYTNVLFPTLPGRVPLPVLGAWLLVVATSCALARWLIPAIRNRAGMRLLAMRVIVAAILGVMLDLVLEPVAVRIERYWAWRSIGPYYGIPTANFIGWAVLCSLLAIPVLAALPWKSSARLALPPDLAGSALWLFVLTVALFTLVDLTHGFAVAALCGIVLVILTVILHHMVLKYVGDVGYNFHHSR